MNNQDYFTIYSPAPYKPKLTITQTIHGHNPHNTSDLSRQKAIDLAIGYGEAVQAGVHGTVLEVSRNHGSYVAILIENTDIILLLVHVYNFQVSRGDKVRPSTVIGNVNHDNHLHLGLKNKSGKAPHPSPMDHFDRNIVFFPWKNDIQRLWFDKNNNILWDKFNNYTKPMSNNRFEGTTEIYLGISNVKLFDDFLRKVRPDYKAIKSVGITHWWSRGGGYVEALANLSRYDVISKIITTPGFKLADWIADEYFKRGYNIFEVKKTKLRPVKPPLQNEMTQNERVLLDSLKLFIKENT